MKFILQISLQIALSGIFVVSAGYAVAEDDCAPGFAEYGNNYDPTIVQEGLVEEVTELETRFNLLRGQPHLIPEGQLSEFLNIEHKITNLADLVLDLDVNNTSAIANIKSQTKKLKDKLYALNELVKKNIEQANTATQGGGADLLIDQIDFSDIEADKVYRVKHSEGRPVSITFKAGVLKEINHRTVDEKTRVAIFRAAVRGIIGTKKSQGIKIMKSFAGTQFVEVKPHLGHAGGYRVFGCIEKNLITLHFLGKDMVSQNDPQRTKIVNLCK